MVVTGASAGIGRATAELFALRGSRVVLASRREDRLQALAEKLQARGGTAVVQRCDVTSLGDLEVLRDYALEAFGRVDVLVNNAGIPGGGRFEDIDFSYLDTLIRTNVTAVVAATKVSCRPSWRPGVTWSTSRPWRGGSQSRGAPCTRPQNTRLWRSRSRSTQSWHRASGSQP